MTIADDVRAAFVARGQSALAERQDLVDACVALLAGADVPIAAVVASYAGEASEQQRALIAAGDPTVAADLRAYLSRAGYTALANPLAPPVPPGSS